MHLILKVFTNRNFILLSALAAGLIAPSGAGMLKSYTSLILALLMVFSISGIEYKTLADYKYVLKVSAISVLMNFVILGSVLLAAAYFIIDDPLVFAGFVVVAATPPGVAVVPFSYTYDSDIRFALTGILGTYLAAVFITPLVISAFSSEEIAVSVLLMTILKVIVIPLLLSRLLRLKKLIGFTEKYRGQIVNWGFAILIYTAVGLNQQLIFSDVNLLLKIIAVFAGGMFLLGIVHILIMRKRMLHNKIISRNLMLTIKSTGFSVATALSLFDEKAAMPAAVMSVFVLLYLLAVPLLKKLL